MNPQGLENMDKVHDVGGPCRGGSRPGTWDRWGTALQPPAVGQDPHRIPPRLRPGDYEVAEQILQVLEMMLTRRPLTPDGPGGATWKAWSRP